MSLNEKDLYKYFIDPLPAQERQTDNVNLVRGTCEMADEDVFEYDYEDEEEEVIQNREEILVLLAAYESEYLEEYKRVFAENGIRIIAVSSEEEFLSFSRIFPVNGIAVDFSSVKPSDETKNLLAELEKNYPFIRIKFNVKTNNIDCSHGFKTLDDFIENKCLKFAARTLRSNKRRPISLNVEISPEKEFVRVERSVTFDISESGLFIFAIAPMWSNAKKCFISIKEFKSETLVECDIVRQIRWGEKPFKAPGIGVKITSIREALQEDFNMLLEKWRLV